MSNISAVQNTPNVLQQTEERTNPIPQQELGSSDFLLLMTEQLMNQDPLKPMEDTEFIAQMASFSSLEQMQTLNDTFALFAGTERMASAQGYLGQEATVFNGQQEISGIVQSVAEVDEQIVLTIDGVEYPSSAITRVSLPSSGNQQQDS
ncbi:MAG: hypothetical protein MK080_04200 [Opitutales bacterium]|nr:hypothetical protein [Opitutales bacterium]NRA26887.1 hypothetical protein [Opitutales bacterium]